MTPKHAVADLRLEMQAALSELHTLAAMLAPSQHVAGDMEIIVTPSGAIARHAELTEFVERVGRVLELARSTWIAARRAEAETALSGAIESVRLRITDVVALGAMAGNFDERSVFVSPDSDDVTAACNRLEGEPLGSRCNFRNAWLDLGN